MKDISIKITRRTVKRQEWNSPLTRDKAVVHNLHPRFQLLTYDFTGIITDITTNVTDLQIGDTITLRVTIQPTFDHYTNRQPIFTTKKHDTVTANLYTQLDDTTWVPCDAEVIKHY